MNRFLRLDTLTPRTLWENVQNDVVLNERGYILFDDMVLDPWRAKDHSRQSRLVRRQWSGNEKRVIYGVGVVTCVYVNPETGRFWVIDYRVYDPEGDDQSKIAHMIEMLDNVLYHKKLPFKTVLMDSWYASMQVMKHIDSLGKVYYCPVKTNRHADDSGGQRDHRRVDQLQWTEAEQKAGKTIHPWRAKDAQRSPYEAVPAGAL